MNEKDIQVEKIKFDKEYTALGTTIGIHGTSQYGYMLDTIPEKVFTSLDNIYREILLDSNKFNDYNQQLVGEIYREYEVDWPDIFKDYITDLMGFYEVKSNNFIKNLYRKMPISGNSSFINKMKDTQIKNYTLPKIKFSKGWVNFMEKYEFNPPHQHPGVLSFVVWFKIPYLFEDERKVSPGRKKYDMNQESGKFIFLYPDFTGQLNNIVVPADKRIEGTICLFPSSLYHSVFPFYSSDEFRVTYSGNIFIDS